MAIKYEENASKIATNISLVFEKGLYGYLPQKWTVLGRIDSSFKDFIDFRTAHFCLLMWALGFEKPSKSPSIVKAKIESPALVC